MANPKARNKMMVKGGRQSTASNSVVAAAASNSVQDSVETSRNCESRESSVVVHGLEGFTNDQMGCSGNAMTIVHGVSLLADLHAAMLACCQPVAPMLLLPPFFAFPNSIWCMNAPE